MRWGWVVGMMMIDVVLNFESNPARDRYRVKLGKGRGGEERMITSLNNVIHTQTTPMSAIY